MTDASLSLVIEKVRQSVRLTDEDALALYRTEDLLTLGELASLANRRKNGERVYFNVNRHVNPTNLCVNRCAFCAFSKSPGEEGAYELTLDEIIVKVGEATRVGATEVHLVGGLHPEWGFDWYLGMVAGIRENFPALHIKGFTAVEIDHFGKISGLGSRESMRRLIEAGLSSMPGGGAEILAEDTRKRICPEKISGARWLEVMEEAHELGLKTNATMLYGHVESLEDRVEHMARLRELQDRTGGFQVFIPLAFQPDNSELAEGRVTTGFDDLKTLAVGRLYLDNFDHVKGYWVMLGEKIAQVSLSFGVDDLDGTVAEEKIAHDAGATSAERMGRHELETLIREAGKTPVERDSLYNPIGQAEG